MAFDPDAFLETYGKTSTDTGQPVAAPVVQASAPATTVSTATTATTPMAARKEAARAEFDKLRAEERVGAVEAAGMGIARGATLGMVDRAVGVGTQIGEDWANMTPWYGHPPVVTGKGGQPIRGQSEDLSRDPNAGATARSEYISREAKAQEEAPISSVVGGAIGATVPTVATMGAVNPMVGRTLAAASGVEAANPTLAIAAQQARNLAANPKARMAAQDFVAGAMNEPSNDPAQQVKSGLGTAAVGGIVGKAAEATVGKLIRGATDREARGLVRDIMRNEETDVAATPTARRRFIERSDAAIKEVREDKQLATVIRSGDTQGAANIARSKLQVISNPREGFYKELDSKKVLGVDEIDKQLRYEIDHATGAKKRALEAMRTEFNEDLVPKWRREGSLIEITKEHKPAPPLPPPAPKDIPADMGLRGTVGRWSPEGTNIERVVDPRKLNLPQETPRGIAARWTPEGKMIPPERPSPPPEKPAPKTTPEQETRIVGVSGAAFRQWVTEAQNAASTVIGQIDEGSRKQIKGALEDVVEGIWHKHLDDVSKVDKKLVQNIRDYDRRASGLLAIEKIMEQRREKDTQGLLGFAKKNAHNFDAAAAATAAVTLPGHPFETVAGLGTYAAARKAPRVAQAINDTILVPLQRAAESGVPIADAMLAASEKGIPAGLVRMAYAGAVHPVGMVKSALETGKGAVQAVRGQDENR